MTKEILRLQSVSKSFPEGKVLDKLSFSLIEGEAMGILSPHDSGKTVLMRILSGKEPADSGEIYLSENPANMVAPENRRMVHLVSNRPALVGSLTVAENVFVIRRHYSFKVFIPRLFINTQLRDKFSQLGINIKPESKASGLAPVERLLVEIAKGYLLGAKLILLDDVFETHTVYELMPLFKLVRHLREKGISFLVSGCQLSRLKMFCSKVLILDKGRALKSISMHQLDDGPLAPSPLAADMHSNLPQGETVFSAKDIWGQWLNGFSLSLNKGEVAIVYDGAQKAAKELYDILSVYSPRWAGHITLEGKPVTKADYHNDSILFTDFDSERHIWRHLSLRDNLSIAIMPKLSFAGFLRQPLLRFVEQDFLRMHPFLGLEQSGANSFSLSRHAKLAITLYSMRLRRSSVVFGFAPEFIADDLSFSIMEKEFSQMAASGGSVCIFTSDLGRFSSIASRIIVMGNHQAPGAETADKYN